MLSFRYSQSAARPLISPANITSTLIITAMVLTVTVTNVWAQCGGCSGGSSSCSKSKSPDSHTGSNHQSHAQHGTPAYGAGAENALFRRPPRAPHGGQVSASEWHRFEVVYTPKETRIYVYSPSMQRMDTESVEGEVIMQVAGNPQLFRYAVQEVTEAPGMGYLSVPVDVSRIRNGDMLVTFDFRNLPFREEPQLRFSQVFRLTGSPGAVAGPPASRFDSPAAVRVSAITDADRPLIARQRLCPVMDSPLGDHGEPIKLLVHGRPLFVCCQGCIDKVKQNPDVYLQKVSSAQAASTPTAQSPYGRPLIALSDMDHRGQHREPRIVVTETTPADQIAIRAQETCPVMGQALGSHGKPVKILVDGSPLFVCCQGCIDKVKQNPNGYLAKANLST